jgi:hypothetical protein
LEAASSYAANDCKVAERQGLVCVFKNEFLDGPNLPGRNTSYGSIHELRVVVSQSLQDESDERSLNLPHSMTRLFMLPRLLIELREHSFYDPSRAMVEVHHRVKIYWANNVTLK